MLAIEQALRDARNIGIDDLPEIDLQGNTGRTDYIDFLTIAHMPPHQDIARFTDRYGRRGVAMRIKSQPTQLDGVIAIFERYRDHERVVYGVAMQPHLDYHKISSAYRQVHDPNLGHNLLACPTCPPFLLGPVHVPEMAVDLLLNRDMAFGLANDLKS